MTDRRSGSNNLQGDIWTSEDDVLLAETVLRNVRQGNSIVKACREMEEVSDGRRTASASKFRWFTKLVEQYKAGYEIAKREGEKVKASKKRKTNKGERFEEIVKNILNEADEVTEPEVDPEDFIVLAKKFKSQQQNKETTYKNLEKQNRNDQKRIQELEKELKSTKAELADATEMLSLRKKDYEKLVEALQVLKKAGIQINIPEPSKPTYSINKSGVVEKVESP